MNVGTEWVVDAWGCADANLRDAAALAAVLDRAVRELGLCVIGRPQWNIFPDPGGITGLLLLSESHLTCHTFPEHGIATFNLYCCQPRPAWPWAERLGEMLGATRVTIRTIDRGAIDLPAARETAAL